MSEPILSIQNLQVNYGGIEAVKGISFDVPEGEIVTLIGANGAGKSSTLRAISGLVKPKSGKILFKHQIPVGNNAHQSLAFCDGHAGNAVFRHQVVGIFQCILRRQIKWIGDHTVL